MKRKHKRGFRYRKYRKYRKCRGLLVTSSFRPLSKTESSAVVNPRNKTIGLNYEFPFRKALASSAWETGIFQRKPRTEKLANKVTVQRDSNMSPLTIPQDRTFITELAAELCQQQWRVEETATKCFSFYPFGECFFRKNRDIEFFKRDNKKNLYLETKLIRLRKKINWPESQGALSYATSRQIKCLLSFPDSWLQISAMLVRLANIKYKWGVEQN